MYSRNRSLGAGTSRNAEIRKFLTFEKAGGSLKVPRPRGGCRWWLELLGEKRKAFPVQKDEDRSLGLRGRFLGLVERVREDGRKINWF